MKKYFAVADVVPEDAVGTLTAGKRYEITGFGEESEEHGREFYITTNYGAPALCLERKCEFLNGNNWRIIERDDSEADESVTAVTASKILECAAGHLKARAEKYDRPEGERSMGAIVAAFENVTGVKMTTEQGWLFMTILKAVRSQQGKYSADSYEDGAAYFALAGESAAQERG